MSDPVLSVLESSVSSGQPATFLVAYTNTSGVDVTVSGVTATLVPVSSSAYLGLPAFVETVLADGETFHATFEGVFHASVRPEGSTTEQSAIGVLAAVLTADANTPTNTVTMQITPAFGPAIAMPVRGQLRFDSNHNSALVSAL